MRTDWKSSISNTAGRVVRLHMHMRQDASLDPGKWERLARDARQFLQEAESLTIPQRRRGMFLSRTELGILLEEMEGIGSEEMQYNMQAFWLKRGNMAGHWLRSGRGLRQSCLGRVTAAAQVAGRMNEKAPGKMEGKALETFYKKE